MQTRGHRGRRILGAVFAITLLAASCGGDDDSSGAPDDSSGGADDSSGEAADTSVADTGGESGDGDADVDCSPVEPSSTGLSDQLFGADGEPGVPSSEVSVSEADIEAARAALEGQKVAISQHIGNSDYTQQVSNNAAGILEDLGAEIIISDANFDAAKQVSDIENLLSQDPVALIMFPVDQSASVPGIQAANAADVPVIVIGSALEDGGEVTSLLAADNYEAGVVAASILREQIGDEGAVAALPVKVSLWHMDERARGFADGVKCTSIEIVEDRQACGGPDDCGPVFADILTAHPDLKGAFGGWDGQAIAMNAAALTAGWDGKITTVDLGKATAQSIVDGGEPLIGAAVQQTDEQGKTAADLVITYLAGNEVPPLVFSPILTGTQDTAGGQYESLFGEPLG